MNKRIRNFFTLTRRANDGFTLVELIVVIAILAILGGVAIPAYSGYIARANRSADEQLLGDLNTAFAAACAFNGEDHYNRKDNPTVTIGEGGVVATTALTTGNENINTAFGTFFESGTFNVFTELFYNKTTGGFAVDEPVTFTFNGKEITLSSKDVAILSGDNAFSDRGSDALLDDVGALQTYLKGIEGSSNEILAAVGNSDDYFLAAGGYMGMKLEDYKNDMDAYRAAVGAALEERGENASTNALIMYSATHAANASQEQIDKLFNGGVTGNIEVKDKDGNRDNEATMANAALAYGMYTAYVERNKLNTAVEGNDFVTIVNTKEFIDYVAGDQGQADLEAYMAAMNMISDNTSNTDVTSDILDNGIENNEKLAELMKEVMGN